MGIKNLFELLEEAQNSWAPQSVLKEKGFKSKRYWRLVDIELARLKRKQRDEAYQERMRLRTASVAN